MAPGTQQRLIEAGLKMMLERGYAGLGIIALLDATGIPKGSFYHHFRDKEDFALQVIDTYLSLVHEKLDECLADTDLPPLDRIRSFFEQTTRQYRDEGYMGCLMGGLGQELANTGEIFRLKIEACFDSIARRIAVCLREAQNVGQMRPDADAEAVADLIVDGWEGAALRSRLRRDPTSLTAMLDFCLDALPAA